MVVQHDAPDALFSNGPVFVINKVLSAIITCSIELNNTLSGRVGGGYYRPIDGNYLVLVIRHILKGFRDGSKELPRVTSLLVLRLTDSGQLNIADWLIFHSA